MFESQSSFYHGLRKTFPQQPGEKETIENLFLFVCFLTYQKVGKGLCTSVGPETTCIFLKSYPLLILN